MFVGRVRTVVGRFRAVVGGVRAVVGRGQSCRGTGPNCRRTSPNCRRTGPSCHEAGLGRAVMAASSSCQGRVRSVSIRRVRTFCHEAGLSCHEVGPDCHKACAGCNAEVASCHRADHVEDLGRCFSGCTHWTYKRLIPNAMTGRSHAMAIWWRRHPLAHASPPSVPTGLGYH